MSITTIGSVATIVSCVVLIFLSLRRFKNIRLQNEKLQSELEKSKSVIEKPTRKEIEEYSKKFDAEGRFNIKAIGAITSMIILLSVFFHHDNQRTKQEFGKIEEKVTTLNDQIRDLEDKNKDQRNGLARGLDAFAVQYKKLSSEAGGAIRQLNSLNSPESRAELRNDFEGRYSEQQELTINKLSSFVQFAKSWEPVSNGLSELTNGEIRELGEALSEDRNDDAFRVFETISKSFDGEINSLLSALDTAAGSKE